MPLRSWSFSSIGGSGHEEEESLVASDVVDFSIVARQRVHYCAGPEFWSGSGSFRFTALPPGQYFVAAFPGVEQGLLESHDFVSRFNAEAARVELSEGTRARIDAPILSGDRIAEEVAKLP